MPTNPDPDFDPEDGRMVIFFESGGHGNSPNI